MVEVEGSKGEYRSFPRITGRIFDGGENASNFLFLEVVSHHDDDEDERLVE